MCYETTLSKKKKTIKDKFNANFAIPLEFNPYYHKSGFSHPNLQIIKMDDSENIYPASWGFVPSWGKEDITAFRKKYNTLNAKSETLFKSGTYKESAHDKRCLIIADGFFEPQKINGVSIPSFCYIPSKTYEDGRDIFVYGGLYSELKETSDAYTCTILTMEANDFFKEIHNVKKRQPFVIDEGLIDEWLNPDLKEDNVLELIKNGFTSKEFKAHHVSRNLYNRSIDTNTETILEEVKSTLF